MMPNVGGEIAHGSGKVRKTGKQLEQPSVVLSSCAISFAIYRYQAESFVVPSDGHGRADVAVVGYASMSYGARRLLSGNNHHK